jgi:hypothetical protein
VRVGVDQRPVVVLAVDFNQQRTGLAHQRHAGRLVVDENPGTAIARLHPAEHQIAVIIDVIGAQQLARRVIGADIEDRRYLPLVSAVAHEAAVTAATKGERKGIEQNGFAGAGLAGENRKTCVKLEIELLDQNDVADRQLDKHRRPLQEPTRAAPAREIQDPLFSRGSRPRVDRSL